MNHIHYCNVHVALYAATHLHGYKVHVHTKHCLTALGYVEGKYQIMHVHVHMYNSYKHINRGKPERALHLQVGDFPFGGPVCHSVLCSNNAYAYAIFYFYSVQHKYYFNAEFLFTQVWPQCPAFQLVFSSGTYPLQNGAVYTH